MSYGMSGCKSVALLLGFCTAVSALAATTFERARVLTANTTVNVADGDVLEIGILSGNYTLTKTGGGTLLVHAVAEPASGGTSISLEEGMLSFTLADAPTAAMGSAFLHLDASKTNTMTLVSENGTNFVTRWNDASGGARYVSHDSASLAWRDASHKPFLRTGFQNGLPVVDLGSYAHPRIVDGAGKGLGWGGALAWSERSDDIREVFLVVSDVDDLASIKTDYPAPSNDPYNGPFLVGATGSYHFHRDRLPNNGHAALYISSHASACIRDGTNYLDGAKVAYSATLPAGFHVVNTLTTNVVSGSTFGRDRTLAFGGLRYAEALVFNSLLDEDDRLSIQAYLSTKWRPVPLKSLKISDGTTLNVGGGASLKPTSFEVVGTATFTGDGTIVDSANNAHAFGTLVVPGGSWSASDGTDSGLSLAFAGDGELHVEGNVSYRDVSAGGKLVKSGSGELLLRWTSTSDSLEVREGKFTLSPLMSHDSFFHVDASDTNTMSITVGDGGTNYVTRWNDAAGGPVYATTAATPSYIPHTSNHDPFLAEGFLNGLPVMDFGGYNGQHYTNSVDNSNIGGWGAAMDWSKGVSCVRKMFTVASDTEDIYTVRTICPGADNNAVPFIGHSSAYRFLRSTLYANGNPPTILSSNKNAWGQVYCEEVRLDGTNVVNKFAAYPKGFHLLEFQISDQQIADNQITAGNTFGRDRGLTYGGTRIAEFLVFTNALESAETERIRAQLMVKWFASTNAWEYGYTDVSVAEGAVAAFPYAAVRVNGTLALDGTIDAVFVRAAGVSVSSASAAVTGRLELPSGANVELSSDAFGNVPVRATVRVIAAGAVAVDGGVVSSGRLPLVATGDLASRRKIRFSAGEDGVYATFSQMGVSIIFR